MLLKHNKVIARIKGGLGNQLFCYAAARRLSLMGNAELVIDHVTGFIRDLKYSRCYALDQFNISARKATPRERMEPFERHRRGLAKLICRQRSFHQRRYLEQEGIDFDPRLLSFKVNGTIYLDGLWQSEDYFKDVQDIIRKDLTIIPPEDEDNKRLAKRINASNAVAVHVRWFDSSNGHCSQHNVRADYYRKAVTCILQSVKEPHFFVFSDNPDAACRLLDLPENVVSVLCHNRGDENAYADLWLMSQCKHFIIANSTFSWWGAWLGENENATIISPGLVKGRITAWGFDGLIPDRWIILEGPFT